MNQLFQSCQKIELDYQNGEYDQKEYLENINNQLQKIQWL